ncbi:MAG TPA: hypothetical protein VGK94_06100 [Candidatus Polarisedimenticolia bacterium]|jgi:arabinofuranosyltransferase
MAEENPPPGTLWPALLFVLLAAMAALAWHQRFVTDDAFISFRYARNLVEGQGLVWNPGERVEGYTNFLWTIILSVPFVLGLDPVHFCFAVGPVLAAVTLLLVSRISFALLPSWPLSLLAVLLVGTNPSFAAWATGGLETQLLTCVQTAALWLLIVSLRRDEPRIGACALLSVLAAAALMIRLDSVVAIGVVMLAAAADVLRRSGSRRRAGMLLAALCAPAALLLGGWFIWKTAYYGGVLPNTYYAKRGGAAFWPAGLTYLRAYFQSYLLAPFLILTGFACRRLMKQWPLAAVTLPAMLCAHYLYVACVGGDFMEFRMLVPALPVLYLLIVWATFGWVRRPAFRAALIVLLLAGAVHHARLFAYTHGIETVSGLESHLYHPAGDWVGVGRALGRALPGSPDVSIAVTAAGAIPYYSRLPSIDMLGLNDPWVARHGIEVRPQPGHTRLAPLGYLVGRGCRLVVAHPWVARASPAARTSYAYPELARFRFLLDVRPVELPPDASILEIPLDETRVVVVLYLTPHPAVEALIQAGRWRRFSIAREAAGTPSG